MGVAERLEARGLECRCGACGRAYLSQREAGGRPCPGCGGALAVAKRWLPRRKGRNRPIRKGSW